MISERASYRPSHRRLVLSFLAAEGAVFVCSPLFVSVPSSSLVLLVVPFSVSPSFRSPSRCRLIPVPVSSAAQSPASSHPPPFRSVRRFVCSPLVARRFVVVPFLVQSRRLVSHSSARSRSPFPRHGRRGVFLFSFDGGRASKQGAGRRRAGDRSDRAGIARGIAIGRSCDGRGQASRRGRAWDRQIRGRPAHLFDGRGVGAYRFS